MVSFIEKVTLPELIKRPERLPLKPIPFPEIRFPFPEVVTQVGQFISPVVVEKEIGPKPVRAFLARALVKYLLLRPSFILSVVKIIFPVLLFTLETVAPCSIRFHEDEALIIQSPIFHTELVSIVVVPAVSTI